MIGRPSAGLADEMAKEEERRLSDQRERLGEQGLKEKEKELQKAMSANEVNCWFWICFLWGGFMSVLFSVEHHKYFFKVLSKRKSQKCVPCMALVTILVGDC